MSPSELGFELGTFQSIELNLPTNQNREIDRVLYKPLQITSNLDKIVFQSIELRFMLNVFTFFYHKPRPHTQTTTNVHTSSSDVSVRDEDKADHS